MDTTTQLALRRKELLKQLKAKGCDYQNLATITKSYNGEGFYINHRSKVYKIQKIWGYDKHWAYGGALRNNLFPITTSISDHKSELGIVLVSFYSTKPKYDDFFYTIYQDCDFVGNHRKYKFMTNIDFEIFKDLYHIDGLVVEEEGYFNHIGKLGIEDLIDEAYQEKKSGKYEKSMYEACYYGLFAKKLWEYKNPAEYKEFTKAVYETGISEPRSRYTIIAMFQTAYLRKEEWELFKQYKDHVVYMNTDSIYSDVKLPIKTKNEIGNYDIEYDGMYIQFIRRNAYVVLKDDGSVYKSVIGGVINAGDITKKKLDDLRNGLSVRAKTYNRNRELIECELKPDFIRYGMGICDNLNYI